MYTEEPRKEINWGSLLKKGLIILIIAVLLFVIFWLIVRGNKPSINVNTNGNDNTNNSNLSDKYYTGDFLENYRYFHDTAKEYFLISELPSEGKTLKYTLKQLIDMGLILPFGYEQKVCDTEASYVLVTNVDGKYKMTVTLVCGTEVAKTTEELGCNQLCTNGNCTTTPDEPSKPNDDADYVLEYEFRKKYVDTVVTYSCPSGYTKDGKTCYKNNDTTIKATATSNYACPSGYTSSGSGANMKCTKVTTTTTDAKYTTDYKCPSGYTASGSGSNMKCTKTTTKTVNATLTTNYTCDNGYVPVGSGANTRCYKKTSDTIPATPTYGCPVGYNQIGNGSCVKTSTSSYKASYKTVGGTCPSGYSALDYYNCATYSTPSKSCKDGYTLSGNSCVKTTTKNTTPSTKCASGYTKSGSTCVANSPTSSAIKKNYTCSTGTLSGTQCKITRTSATYTTEYTDHGQTYNGCTKQSVSIAPCTSGNCNQKVYTYYCPAGSYYYKDATISYSCASGYTQKGSGTSTQCYKNDSSKLQKYCSTGKLNGNVCTSTTTSTDNSKLVTSCPSGYTLSGNSCVKYIERIWENQPYCPNGGVVDSSYNYCVVSTTDIKPASINYYCSISGYTLSGTTCYRTTDEYKVPNTTNGYNCSEGTLNGTQCIVSTTSSAEPIKANSYYCPTGTLNGTRCTIQTNDVQNATITDTYSCPNGFKKYGEGSNTTCTKGVIYYTDATATSSTVEKYKYQWSTQTNIDGWEKTGNSRKVKASVK